MMFTLEIEREEDGRSISSPHSTFLEVKIRLDLN